MIEQSRTYFASIKSHSSATLQKAVRRLSGRSALQAVAGIEVDVGKQSLTTDRAVALSAVGDVDNVLLSGCSLEL